MYDSTDATAIPADAEMVAGYVDGRFVWPQAWWDRFPNATKVRIAVFASTNDGTVLDVENGDATPAQAPRWLQNRLAAGESRPTIYCSRDARDAVEAACQGIQHDLWIGTLDGTENIPGTVAVQYAGTAITHADFDLSIVTDDTWPGGLNVAQLDDIRGVLFDESGSWPQAWLRQFLEGEKNSDINNVKVELDAVKASLDQITQAIATLKQPPVDVAALVQALIPALLKEMGKDLSNG